MMGIRQICHGDGWWREGNMYFGLLGCCDGGNT